MDILPLKVPSISVSHAGTMSHPILDFTHTVQIFLMVALREADFSNTQPANNKLSDAALAPSPIVFPLASQSPLDVSPGTQMYLENGLDKN